MRFLAREAGWHWQEWERLAALCEAAGLTSDQAEAARLVASGIRIEHLAPALSQALGQWVSGRQARRKAWEAGVRIRRSRPDLASGYRDYAVELLCCMRNVRACRNGDDDPPSCRSPGDLHLPSWTRRLLIRWNGK